MSKMQWEKLTSRGSNFSGILISTVIHSFQNDATFKLTDLSTPQYYRQLDGGRWFNSEYLIKIDQELKLLQDKDPQRLLQIALDYQQDLKLLRQWTAQWTRNKVKDLGAVELAQIWSQYFALNDPIYAVVYWYIFLNKFLPDQLIPLITQKEKDNDKRNQYTKILLSLDRKSESRAEKEDLLNLVIKIKKNGWRLNSSAVQEDIVKHLDKYAFLGQYFYNKSPYSVKDIEERIKALRHKDLAKELRESKAQDNNQRMSAKIMTSLKFTNKERLLVSCIKEWAFAANSFDEDYTAANYNMREVIKASARRIGVSPRQLIEMSCDELLAGLKDEEISPLLAKKLIERQNDNAIIMEEDSETFLSGQELVKYLRQEVKQDKIKYNLKELVGQSAQEGLVQGRVRLILKFEDVSKLKRGEILVAPSTAPTHVPAMEKAGAIVTDEGGLLSHAAIVSRELRVPCVVGTKIGTKVLNNGDEIEVDASRGIVRILK